MVPERLGVALDAAHARRSRPCDGVVSNSWPRGASTRLTSESHRAVSATCSITSLAQTRSKRAVLERQRPVDRHEQELELRMPRLGPPHGRRGDLRADHARPRPATARR